MRHCHHSLYAEVLTPALQVGEAWVTPILNGMRVYLCRHAQAAPDGPDELRGLTPVGIEIITQTRLDTNVVDISIEHLCKSLNHKRLDLARLVGCCTMAVGFGWH